MPHPVDPIDLSPLKTCPISSRKRLVKVDDFARPWKKGGRFRDFLETLPAILAGDDVRSVIAAIARAGETKAPVILGMGGHVIKVGLGPLIIDFMDRGVVTAAAMNGAGIIHDLEVALCGETSEDVGASLGDGSFGMGRETCAFLSDAIRSAGRTSMGLGEAVGRSILDARLPFTEKSILAAGARLGLPVTVHVAMGTDILHMHPEFDPGACGRASHLDFRTFAAMVAGLEGGVYMNVGSAVMLPEIFLKAISLARNLGHRVEKFTAVNMDFIHHYRPATNVVNRPTALGGRGFNLIGRHEIMLPLIAAGVIEQTGDQTPAGVDSTTHDD